MSARLARGRPAWLSAGAAIGIALLALLALRAMDARAPRLYARATLATALDRAERAVLANQLPSGLFVYELSRPDAPDQNDVRQLLTTKWLAGAAARRPALAPAHRKNLAAVMGAWYREEEGRGYVWFNGHSKLGSNGLLLSALALSPAFEEHRTQALRLAEGILSLVDDDGAISPWYKPPPPPYDSELWSRYAVGEAMLGLLDLHGRTKDPRLLDAAKKVQGYYLDHFVVQLERFYHPACVPWQTQTLHRLWKQTGRRAYAEAAFVLTDKLLEMQVTRPEQAQYVGRFWDPRRQDWGPPHAASDGVYTEGLAYAYELALGVGDPARRSRYGRAIGLGVDNLLRLQIPAGDPQLPAQAAGAIRTNVDEGQATSRLDNTQHTIDAWTRLLALPDEAVRLPR